LCVAVARAALRVVCARAGDVLQPPPAACKAQHAAHTPSNVSARAAKACTVVSANDRTQSPHASVTLAANLHAHLPSAHCCVEHCSLRVHSCPSGSVPACARAPVACVSVRAELSVCSTGCGLASPCRLACTSAHASRRSTLTAHVMLSQHALHATPPPPPSTPTPQHTHTHTHSGTGASCRRGGSRRCRGCSAAGSSRSCCSCRPCPRRRTWGPCPCGLRVPGRHEWGPGRGGQSGSQWQQHAVRRVRGTHALPCRNSLLG
jgi:hypothetical protein